MKQHQPKTFISRAAAMLLTVIMAFAGAQTARAQNTCFITFDISGKGTVEFDGGSVTNGKPIDCLILPGKYLTITPETGYYVSSVTYDATDGLIIFLNQNDAFQWSLIIHQYKVYDTPTITVHIVFDKGLAGGADEASAVELTADDDLSHLTGGWYKVESDLTLGHTVNLHGDTHIIIASGATLTVNTSDEYGISGSALTVSGEGTLSVSANERAISVNNYTQTGCAVTLSGNTDGLYTKNNVSISGGSLTTSGADYGIESNKGAITISGGTVSSSGDSAGLIAGDAMNITGGQVNVSSGGIYSTYGDITLGLTSATDYITASGFTVEEGFYVRIATGQTLYDGTNTYDDQTPSATLAALINVTLRNYDYYRTVAFDSNGGSAVDAQTVLHGEKATEPADPSREGYTFGGWKNGEDDYDFDAAVTSNLYLTAKWTPITYTVQFDNNGGSGTMDAVVATYDQWTSIPSCTFTAPTGYAMKEWNRQADGSGDSFYAEYGDFRNLASEQGATVTLYAQWGKDIALCTADVPDPIYHPYSFHGYFYDGTWNDNHGNIKVYDGETLLTYGTDYQFTMMESLDDGSCEELGEHCRVYLQGIGAYAGILYKDVVIAPATVTDAKWGSLTWNLDGEGNFTITGTGAMDAASDNSDYDWYNYSSYFTSITIGEGITTVAAKAFGGDNNTNPYGGVTTVDLPSTLTTIGENAFAYCTGATFNADNLIAQGVTIGDNAFNQVGCIEGTLSNNGDNTTMLSLMANARSANVTITGRTLYKDGNWNTICLPFDVKSDNSLLTDATIKELDLYGYYSEEGVYYSYAAANLRRTGFDAENGTLYLYFKDATADSDDNLLKAGTPYLIKWPSGGTDITGDLTFEGVKVISSPQTLTSEDGQVSFRGTYASTTFDAENKSILLLGEANALYWPQSGASIGACRAYFEMNGGANAVRSFVLNFGEETSSMHNAQFTMHNEAGAWYTLDGRKLDAQPMKAGLYIHGGRKVVVK